MYFMSTFHEAFEETSCGRPQGGRGQSRVDACEQGGGRGKNLDFIVIIG